MGDWKAVRQQMLRRSDQAALRIELYDLAKDVGESKDVAAEHPDIVDRMRKFLHDAREYVESGALGRVIYGKAWETARNGAVHLAADSEPPTELDYHIWQGPAPERPTPRDRSRRAWRPRREPASPRRSPLRRGTRAAPRGRRGSRSRV